MRTEDIKVPFDMNTAEGRTRKWLLDALEIIQSGGEADDCPSFEEMRITTADIVNFFESIEVDCEKDRGTGDCKLT